MKQDNKQDNKQFNEPKPAWPYVVGLFVGVPLTALTFAIHPILGFAAIAGLVWIIKESP